MFKSILIICFLFSSVLFGQVQKTNPYNREEFFLIEKNLILRSVNNKNSWEIIYDDKVTLQKMGLDQNMEREIKDLVFLENSPDKLFFIAQSKENKPIGQLVGISLSNSNIVTIANIPVLFKSGTLKIDELNQNVLNIIYRAGPDKMNYKFAWHEANNQFLLIEIISLPNKL